jgi:hypothetical protein
MKQGHRNPQPTTHHNTAGHAPLDCLFLFAFPVASFIRNSILDCYHESSFFIIFIYDGMLWREDTRTE